MQLQNLRSNFLLSPNDSLIEVLEHPALNRAILVLTSTLGPCEFAFIFQNSQNGICQNGALNNFLRIPEDRHGRNCGGLGHLFGHCSSERILLPHPPTRPKEYQPKRNQEQWNH
jgi:hypothetical protein